MQRYSTNVVIPASLGVIFIGVPLIACVPSLRSRVYILFLPFRRCFSSIPTTQVRRHLHFLRNCNPIPLFNHFFSGYPPPYTTYPDTISEEAYWTSAFSGQRALASSNANTRSGTAVPGLLVYYAPALLPVYRDGSKTSKKGVEGGQVYISPRTFLKWHQIVFPDSVSVCFLFVNELHADETMLARSIRRSTKPPIGAGISAIKTEGRCSGW
jgi:hypothetical protein